VERLLWEQDVAGSNPVFPTILNGFLFYLSLEGIHFDEKPPF
jgi:hypothetical protein